MSALKELVMFWNEKSAELLNRHTNPGHDNRRFAVIQIAIHDTLNYFEGKYRKFSHVNSLRPHHKTASPEEAINSAACETLKWAIEDTNDWYIKFEAETTIPPPDTFNQISSLNQIDGWYINKKVIDDSNAVFVGKEWAKAIIKNREGDGSKSIKILSTVPADGGPNDEGVFRADYYKFPPAVAPEKNKLLVDFGDVTPLVINSSNQFRQNLNYTAVQRATEIDEVKEKGSSTYVINDEDLFNKTEFWSDLRQHVIWNNFAREIIHNNYNNLDAWQIARIFALIHTAMADGAISMFKDIYHFKHWRPVTAINNAEGVSPLSTNPSDNVWKARYPTPRVPEYPSTFGISGGAVGAILESIFTSGPITQINLSFTNKAKILKNITYTKISDAVLDNSTTKIYCGWNFRKSTKDSIIQGRSIGQYVLSTQFQQIN